MTSSLVHADCFDWLAGQAANSLHAVCTDPPYGLVEYRPEELEKLRRGKGGVWRIPPKLNGIERNPLPRFTVLSEAQKDEIAEYFERWGLLLAKPMVPGGHVLIASNPTLQQYVFLGMVRSGYEHRATLIRLYHGFRGGDRPKNAEREFPDVCVTPRGKYEPWLLFRKPLSEKTVAQNLRKWGTGGLRMLKDSKPLPDVIVSGRTPQAEQRIAAHPSLKPQHLLRCLVRSLLPIGEGVVLDPFMGSGSTVAAARVVGYNAIGVEVDATYFAKAPMNIDSLSKLSPEDRGEELHLEREVVSTPIRSSTPSLFSEM